MKSSATPSFTPRRRNGTSRGTPGLGRQTTLQQQFENMMGIPEESTQSSGVEDFLNGMQTPSRSRNRHTPSGRSSSNRRRVATPINKSNNRTTNENDASPNIRSRNNSFVHSSSKTPKTKTSSNAKAGGSIVRSPTEIIISPAKKLYQKVANRGSARKEVMKDASTQTDYWVNEAVFKLRLNQGVKRSLQNRAQGDQNRGDLGAGNVMVLKCVGCNATFHICQFEGDNGKKFQANIPKSSEAHKHMFLNSVQNSLVWDAYDSSRKETFLRRFYFFFDSGYDMFAFLLQFFGGQDVDIVKEFLRGENGRFMARTELPPHSIVKNEDDMDVDSDDEDHRPAPLTEEEEKETYGEVNKETQLF